VRVLQAFVDTLHHGKEEDILFAHMCEAGMPRDAGPIGVMLHEHQVGRGHVKKLVELTDGSGPLTDKQLDELREHATQYAALLSRHIIKENNVLYPMATQMLASTEPGASVSQRTRDYETAHQDEKADLVAVARKLVAEYGTHAEGASACTSCGGHHTH
jgi:hemerythrin-like domain-containing protein